MKHFPALILLTMYVFPCSAFNNQQQTPVQLAAPAENSNNSLIPVNHLRSMALPGADQLKNYTHDTIWQIHIKEGVVCAYKADRPARMTNTPFKRSKQLDSAAYLPGILAIQHVNNGFLVGDRKEHNKGGLYWMSMDREQSYLIARGNAFQIKRNGDKYYILQTGETADSASGYVKEAVFKNGRWEAVRLGKISGVPYCMDQDQDGNSIVITSTGLYKVKTDMQSTTLSSLSWSPLNPTTLIVHDNNVYVGMRKGIFKYNLTTSTPEWLIQ